MIYSTNRTSSLGGSNLNEIDVNESYFGIGAQDFYQECAQDELSMFEMAIKSDIDEALIGESTYELEALNEGFVESAKKKIIDMMEKLKEWLVAIMRSVIAKLTNLVCRDNEKFAKAAKKQIGNMPNNKKFKFTGKIVTGTKPEELAKWMTSIDALKNAASKEGTTPENAEALIKTCSDNASECTLEKLVNSCTKEVKDVGSGILEQQIDKLELLTKKNLKDLRKGVKENISTANTIIADIKKLKSDNDTEKNAIDARGKLAAAYKSNCQAYLKVSISLLKALSKIARKPVAKAMGATPKNEGVEFDEELNDALIEAVEYEYDSALEEMSEGCCKNEESDDADDDFDDEDED